MFWRNKNEGAIQILIQHANVLSDEALKRFEELKAITTSLDKGWEDQITSKTSDIIALASGRSAILKTISDLSNKKTKKPVRPLIYLSLIWKNQKNWEKTSPMKQFRL